MAVEAELVELERRNGLIVATLVVREIVHHRSHLTIFYEAVIKAEEYQFSTGRMKRRGFTFEPPLPDSRYVDPVMEKIEAEKIDERAEEEYRREAEAAEQKAEAERLAGEAQAQQEAEDKWKYEQQQQAEEESHRGQEG